MISENDPAPQLGADRVEGVYEEVADDGQTGDADPSEPPTDVAPDSDDPVAEEATG